MSLDDVVQQQLKTMCVNITRLRKERGITTQKLAEEAHVAVSKLRAVESGMIKQNFMPHDLVALCDYFHVSASWLLEEH